jgi:hypothetical protein
MSVESALSTRRSAVQARTPGTDRRPARPRRALLAALLSTLMMVMGFIAVPAAAPAEANGPGMGFYLAPPFVQTPKYSAALLDFNDLSAGKGASPTTWTGISTANGVVGDWDVSDGGDYGGATTTSPTAPGDPQGTELATTRSRYASIAPGGSLSIDLATSRNCFGFWWSAGDARNTVELYTDGGTRLVATLTTEGVVQILNGGMGNITARDGTTTYAAADYYGHPVSGGGARDNDGEPYAYVHAIADGGVLFDRIVLTQPTGGGGFEFDNFAVGTGCEVDAKFVTIDDDLLDPTFAASLATPATPTPVSTLAMSCSPDPVVPGGTVTCQVTGGDPNIDILWRASLDGGFASQGVRLDADGNGTFTFVAPAGSAGRSITVELVDWNVSTSVGVTGQALPSAIRAGGGPLTSPTALLLGSSVLLAALLTTRLRIRRPSEG